MEIPAQQRLEERSIDRWGEACLSHSLFGPVYGVRLTRYERSDAIAYGVLDGNGLTIPEGTDVSCQELLREYYRLAPKSSEERFRESFTHSFNVEPLLSVLNRRTLGVEESTEPWFHILFDAGVEEDAMPLSFTWSTTMNALHGYTHGVTIRASHHNGQYGAGGMQEELVNEMRKSLPHIQVEPFHKDDYLQAVESILPSPGDTSMPEPATNHRTLGWLEKVLSSL